MAIQRPTAPSTKASTSGAPFTGLTSILVWRSIHIHSKVWDEIIDPFLNFNGATVEDWEWINNFIPHFITTVITYPC